jgi:hypothetical protein
MKETHAQSASRRGWVIVGSHLNGALVTGAEDLGFSFSTRIEETGSEVPGRASYKHGEPGEIVDCRTPVYAEIVQIFQFADGSEARFVGRGDHAIRYDVTKIRHLGGGSTEQIS